jgi:hypothetical protein
MDFVSHAIIGGIAGSASKQQKRDIIFGSLFSVLPDIAQIPLFFYIGFLRNRFLWMPLDADWAGLRALHPGWVAFWDIPHSIFFVLLVLAPLSLKFKWPKIALYGYMMHIVVDMFTHAGEWTVKPLYPFNLSFQGFTSAWAWPWSGFIGSWIFLLLVFFTATVLFFLSNKIKKLSKI